MSHWPSYEGGVVQRPLTSFLPNQTLVAIYDEYITQVRADLTATASTNLTANFFASQGDTIYSYNNGTLAATRHGKTLWSTTVVGVAAMVVKSLPEIAGVWLTGSTASDAPYVVRYSLSGALMTTYTPVGDFTPNTLDVDRYAVVVAGLVPAGPQVQVFNHGVWSTLTATTTGLKPVQVVTDGEGGWYLLGNISLSSGISWPRLWGNSLTVQGNNGKGFAYVLRGDVQANALSIYGMTSPTNNSFAIGSQLYVSDNSLFVLIETCYGDFSASGVTSEQGTLLLKLERTSLLVLGAANATLSTLTNPGTLLFLSMAPLGTKLLLIGSSEYDFYLGGQFIPVADPSGPPSSISFVALVDPASMTYLSYRTTTADLYNVGDGGWLQGIGAITYDGFALKDSWFLQLTADRFADLGVVENTNISKRVVSISLEPRPFVTATAGAGIYLVLSDGAWIRQDATARLPNNVRRAIYASYNRLTLLPEK